MKKVIFLFLFLQVSNGFAQRPNGGRGNQNGGQRSTGQERPKFEAAKVAGLIEYSSKKVLKKVKLKKNDSIVEKVIKSIETYNSEISKIKSKNKDLFEGLEIVVNQNMEAIMKNRNRELMQETRKMIEEKLNPIRNEVKTLQDNLDGSMEAVLTEEQNTKWLDYKTSELEKLQPKRRGNDARNRPDDMNGRSGRRRG
ncbi:hypothetical protein [Winogradskyella sp. PG-2]|uniref:hypothetical protein n=1 Tax=Winogradskyella sp. PG-2 TaxID=754409 RepID=UPI0004585DE8|nr:hypothetical protein [Winogradskyella sp. PG-2]BAO76998.1 hypothetical protein WPG_2768 [Winogradskyella sp. PG-2]